ncbi:putative death on curing protein [Leadbettera azotonutricia ZAS-9]|uniref:Putative death on curing protein n=1 Tax=Leadbettera azotonutricia (strain ATCC BAA-888 / DSM 13862 / ZAS-9) TaxID=545695 RepID=F5YAM5_LEAAZ|nr:putative death on curing protein [Leadbettera azotonutricia ZAS-9]
MLPSNKLWECWFFDVNGIPVHCANEELIKLGLGFTEGRIDEAAVIDLIVERNT